MAFSTASCHMPYSSAARRLRSVRGRRRRRYWKARPQILREIIGKAHVYNSYVARAEIVRHLLEVRRHVAGPFRSGLERQLHHLSMEASYDKTNGRIPARGDARDMGPMLVVVEGRFQSVSLTKLVGGHGTRPLLDGSGLGRIDSIAQVLHPLRFRERLRILPLLGLREREEPGCGRIAGAVETQGHDFRWRWDADR
jgi:hypothetical protein